MSDASLDLLHYEDYAPHINSKFTAQFANGATLDLELANVEEKSPSPRQEQFILTFRGPRNGPREQQIFNLHHTQLGSGIMFLVPVGMDANGLTYEAVFNRPK
ncbi:MAG TPA: hypothetical protein PLD20_29910 [Blastocatellia bacterium]|nr:hypothetical protein [Blastocatellia bacterium]HMX29447.1 hypothetical protein [Blastocatellia bacterium]HMY72378.1 hypothetical protein [Blastocatellia bacterium]HMZ22185.1 hypothetical protein [Blastocatellia bacterium]HNG31245.1 hypothetical protein [Blastocatellia bacterium]